MIVVGTAVEKLPACIDRLLIPACPAVVFRKVAELHILSVLRFPASEIDCLFHYLEGFFMFAGGWSRKKKDQIFKFDK